MIVVGDVWKKYIGNDYYSLKNVEFTIQKNTICGLLGHNGAGKSTLMKIISTLYRPDRGTVTVDGFDTVKQPEEVKKSLGIVFETPRLYEQLTGEENILYFASLFGINKLQVKERVQKMYRDLEVDFQDQRVVSYSKGMKQKISIIRALAIDPKIVLMDEPTSGLDIISRSLIREYIFQLKKHGKTVIVTSHIAEDIEKLCDQVVILNKGQVLENSTIEDLKKKYKVETFEEIYINVQKSNVHGDKE